jgi:exodeoxyribonuclease-3
MFTIATFNANSIRSRIEIVLSWLKGHKPDVLCLQETKVQDADFPQEAFAAEGWHAVYRGEKSYNGVAIISRAEPEKVAHGFDDAGPRDEARIIRARIGHVDIVNTYVPQGQSVDSPVFKYKLEWFARLRRLFEKEYSPSGRLIWAGDLNVAPEAIDVYDAKHLAGSVCFHPDEHAALKGVTDWGLVDVFRRHNTEPGQFTFWDYRIPNSVKRNLGWRLDHVLATKTLAGKCTRCHIDREPRLAEKPSDHTFLVAEFDI